MAGHGSGLIANTDFAVKNTHYYLHLSEQTKCVKGMNT